MRWLVLIAALVGAGCEDRACEVPDMTLYSCEPIPNGAYGCIGGPKWVSYDGEEGRHEDPDLTFPRGCRAEIPDCSAYYQGSRRIFECYGHFTEPSDAGVDG
ncbi:MAG TPA: hypothetical protein VIV11_19985, partial [Kofleriaceae bacterium]